MDKVITGKDLAVRDGCKTQQEWIDKLSKQMARRNQLNTPFTGRISGDAAIAEIDFGRWIARCPVCGGAEYVDPDEKLFYCFDCGNREVGGDARPVTFPESMERIQRLVMTRPVMKMKGRTEIEREMLAIAIVPGLARSWKPGESIEELSNRNKAIKHRGGR